MMPSPASSASNTPRLFSTQNGNTPPRILSTHQSMTPPRFHSIHPTTRSVHESSPSQRQRYSQHLREGEDETYRSLV